MCSSGETLIKVKREVLHTGRPRLESIDYVHSVGPCVSGESYSCTLGRVNSYPPFLCLLNLGVQLFLEAANGNISATIDDIQRSRRRTWPIGFQALGHVVDVCRENQGT